MEELREAELWMERLDSTFIVVMTTLGILMYQDAITTLIGSSLGAIEMNPAGLYGTLVAKPILIILLVLFYAKGETRPWKLFSLIVAVVSAALFLLAVMNNLKMIRQAELSGLA